MCIIQCIFKDDGKTVGIPGENGTETARGFFTLNSLIYDAAHNYLIPRAVAYSAGLSNHFFRGKIHMQSELKTNAELNMMIRG